MYLVSINNTWTTTPSTIADAESRGFIVKPSRTDGDFQMFLNGKMVGWMFKSQVDQFAFLQSRGLLD